jgi:hypothetical protein
MGGRRNCEKGKLIGEKSGKKLEVMRGKSFSVL